MGRQLLAVGGYLQSVRRHRRRLSLLFTVIIVPRMLGSKAFVAHALCTGHSEVRPMSQRVKGKPIANKRLRSSAVVLRIPRSADLSQGLDVLAIVRFLPTLTISASSSW
jgi:hypothetical protein